MRGPEVDTFESSAISTLEEVGDVAHRMNHLWNLMQGVKEVKEGAYARNVDQAYAVIQGSPVAEALQAIQERINQDVWDLEQWVFGSGYNGSEKSVQRNRHYFEIWKEAIRDHSHVTEQLLARWTAILNQLSTLTQGQICDEESRENALTQIDGVQIDSSLYDLAERILQKEATETHRGYTDASAQILPRIRRTREGIRDAAKTLSQLELQQGRMQTRLRLGVILAALTCALATADFLKNHLNSDRTVSEECQADE